MSFIDQSGADVVTLTGADRVRFLQGMCMGDVATLPPGGFLRTATLNAKGRLLAIYDVCVEGDALVLVTEAGQGEALRAVLERHAIADDVGFALGRRAIHRVWETPADVWQAPPIFGPPPGPAAPPDEVEWRRIEAGLPRYGVDASDEHFPFETPLARLIDYRKGCYVGQEPVARVHARGSASRMLRGLAIEGDAPVAPGTSIAVGDRTDGVVTSSARSPRFGVIALGYLHRTVWQPGGEAIVAGRRARIVELPFG